MKSYFQQADIRSRVSNSPVLGRCIHSCLFGTDSNECIISTTLHNTGRGAHDTAASIGTCHITRNTAQNVVARVAIYQTFHGASSVTWTLPKAANVLGLAQGHLTSVITLHRQYPVELSANC